jgi:hypothetical protein
MNIEAALKYPFTKENWKKPFAVIFGLYFVVLGLPSLIRIPGTLASIFTANNDYLAGPASAAYFTTTFLAFGLSLLSLPLSVYVAGYLIKIYNSVRHDEEMVPEHTNIGETLINGLKILIVNFVYAGIPVLVFMFFLAISLISFGVGVGIGNDSSIGLGVVGGLISGFLAFLSFLALLAVTVLVVPAVNYEFIRNNNSISAAFDLEKVREVIKVGAKNFFIGWLVTVAMAMALGVLMLFGFCLAFVLQPAVQAYILFLSGSIYGTIFKELDKTFMPAKTVKIEAVAVKKSVKKAASKSKSVKKSKK